MARRLIPAAEHPLAAAIVADWLVTEWAHLYPDWDRRAAVDELTATGQQQLPPCTWLLTEDEADTDEEGDEADDEGTDERAITVLGSVGLSLGGELESPTDLTGPTPTGVWVVNLFVAPEARGHGYGTMLLDHAIDHAAALGIDTLLLTTEHSARHYRSRGWQDIGQTTLNGHPSTVMRLTLGRPVAP